MRPRQDLAELFSTFLQLETGTSGRWSHEPALRRSILRALQLHPTQATQAFCAIWEGVGGCVLRVMPEMVMAEGVTAEGVTAEGVTGNDRTTDEIRLVGEAEAAESEDEQPEPYGLRVWGYASHRQLKERGDYDPQTRNYVLSRPDLQEDLTALGVTLRHCDTQGTQAVVEPLAMVSAVQRENLLERLGDPALAFPRLAIHLRSGVL